MRAWSGTAGIRFRNRASDEILPSRFPRVPPQTIFGPETRRSRGGAPSQNRFETARPFDVKPAYLSGVHSAFVRGCGDQLRQRQAGKPRPGGVPGSALCRHPEPGAPPSRTMPYLAPSESAMRSALPATKQAAGVPSAWSQPLPVSHARPRRWCDAGSPGRQCVTAAQKAGVEGMVRNSGSDRERGRIRIRGRCNQPASVHHRRRRDAGATSIAAPFVAPPSLGR